jgi:beta-lactamase class C
MAKRKIRNRLGLLLIVALLVVTFFVLKRNKSSIQKIIPLSARKIPEKKKLPNPHLANLLSTFEKKELEVLKRTKTPGLAIAVVQDTSIVYIKGFGVRELGKKDSVDIHTVFRLASVSKCFAPILTGLLVEQGVLGWDDKIVSYLPEFSLQNKAYADSLTIRHVLSHTTGLPYHTYTNLVEEGMDLKSMVALLKDVKLTGKPGEIYSYQNVAYSLIGEVIEAATRKPYTELMNEKVFRPLQMYDASMSYSDILLNPNVAHPHMLWRKGWKVTSINDTYYNVAPAGGVNASISDMAQLIKMLVGNKKLVTKETLTEIFKPAVRARSKNRNFRRWIDRADSYYALGWRVLNFKTDTLLYHGGYVNGYRSEIAINRRDKIGICVLSNGPGELVDNSVPYFFSLYFDNRKEIVDWEKKH